MSKSIDVTCKTLPTYISGTVTLQYGEASVISKSFTLSKPLK